MAQKKINRTFRVREGVTVRADCSNKTFTEEPFISLDDEPIPENAVVNRDYLVYASMPVHDFYSAAIKKEK